MAKIPDISILKKHYIDEDLSIREICSIYSISYEAVQRRLRLNSIRKSNSLIRTKINKRIENTAMAKYGTLHHMSSEQGYNKYKNALKSSHNISNIMQLERVKNNRARTCIIKYGYDHSLKSPIIRSKLTKTCMERYGVDNPFKSKLLMANAVANRKNNDHYFGGGKWIDTRFGKIFTRSSYERTVIRILEQCHLVRTLKYESIHITTADINYTPDLLVNSSIILEIKPSRFIFSMKSDFRNQFIQNIINKNIRKHKVAMGWSKVNGYKYYLLTENKMNYKYISKIIAKHGLS